MEHVTGFLALGIISVLTACMATLPDSARSGPSTVRTMGSDQPPVAPTPRPIVSIDQPIQRMEPPISLERSPVLDAALSKQSNAAIIMFLLQHPGDRFTEMARDHLNARRTPDSPAAQQAAAGPDTALVAAFDAARLEKSDAAWAEFLARYGDSPLAAEVPFFR